jgi:hypothetical protein
MSEPTCQTDIITKSLAHTSLNLCTPVMYNIQRYQPGRPAAVGSSGVNVNYLERGSVMAYISLQTQVPC